MTSFFTPKLLPRFIELPAEVPPIEAPAALIREPPQVLIQPPPPAPDCYSIDQLKEMALRQAARLKTPLPVYLKAWAQSMAPVLQQSNITQQQFLNSIKL